MKDHYNTPSSKCQQLLPMFFTTFVHVLPLNDPLLEQARLPQDTVLLD